MMMTMKFIITLSLVLLQVSVLVVSVAWLPHLNLNVEANKHVNQPHHQVTDRNDNHQAHDLGSNVDVTSHSSGEVPPQHQLGLFHLFDESGIASQHNDLMTSEQIGSNNNNNHQQQQQQVKPQLANQQTGAPLQTSTLGQTTLIPPRSEQSTAAPPPKQQPQQPQPFPAVTRSPNPAIQFQQQQPQQELPQGVITSFQRHSQPNLNYQPRLQPQAQPNNQDHHNQPQQQQPPPLPIQHPQQPVQQSQQPNIYPSPMYPGHNAYIEILKPNKYADDNIVTLNLSHSHIYEIDSDAFVGQRFEHIDLSNNKLGLIHSRSFRIGPAHSKHNPYHPNGNNSKPTNGASSYPTRRPPPTHPKSVTIDFSQNPAIVALSGAFDHIDVPNCLLNFTNSTVELKFGAFKKYFKEHPGHIIDIESVDCCEQEWLLSYKHNFVHRTHCDHDPSLFLSKVPQQTIIDSCIAYVTRARHSMTIQGPSVIQQVAAASPRSHSNGHIDNQYLTYVILGGTAMILTSLSIYIIFYMFSLKAAFVYQMQQPSSMNQHKS